MAFDAGSIVGKLILDDSKWKASIEKAKADSKSLEGAVLRSSKSVRELGLALAAVGAAASYVGAQFVKLAAEAVESENLFDVSLGKMSNSARAWSSAVSESLGLNQYEIRKTVGTLDVMLKSMGASEERAYAMSKSLVNLSQDMASFYNLSPAEAFDKVRAGMVGMSRPLQDLGILVNDTVIKNWALTNGIIKQGQEMTELQKVYARYAVMLQATKDSQGDLARTMDSPMNQMRRMKATTDELGISLGKGLLPAVSSVLRVMNPLLTSVKNLAVAFPQATQSVMTFAASLAIVSVVGGSILLILPKLAEMAVAAGTTLGAVAGSVALTFLGWAAAITAVVWALQNFDFLKAIFYTFAEAVNSALSFAIKGLSDFLDWLAKISPIAKYALRDARDSMAQIAHGFEENANLMRDASYKSLEAQERKNAEATANITVDVKGLGNEYGKMWDGAAEAAREAGDQMAKDSDNWLKKMIESFDVAEEMGKRTFNAMADSISGTLYDAVTGTFTSLTDAAKSFGNAILKILLDIFSQWMTMKLMMGLGSVFSAGAGAASTVSGISSAASTTTLSGTSYTAAAVSVPSYDVGSEYVPRDTMAKLHKGETVLQPGEGGGRIIRLTIHNAITPEAIASGMQSREGVDTIINVVNSDSLRNGVTRREVKTR